MRWGQCAGAHVEVYGLDVGEGSRCLAQKHGHDLAADTLLVTCLCQVQRGHCRRRTTEVGRR